MITPYSPPQQIINQQLEIIETTNTPERYAFILGPNFSLHRYLVAAERALMKGVPFIYNASSNPTTWQLVPYEGLLASYIVDQGYVQLFGEMLEGRYWLGVSHVQETDATLYDFQLASLTQPNAIHVIRRGAYLTATWASYSGQITGGTVVFGGSGYPVSSTVDVPVVGGTGTGAVLRMVTNSSGVVVSVTAISPGSGYTANVSFEAPSAAIGANVGAATATLIPELYGRPVQAGDVLYASLGGTTLRRTVVSVENETTPSSFGTDTAVSNQEFAASPSNPVETDAASFGNVAAPSGWNAWLNHTTLKSLTLVSGGTGSPYSNTLTTVVISSPLAVANPTPWVTTQALAEATVVGGTVTGLTLSDPGAGYFYGGIVGIYAVSGGSGYTSTNLPTIGVTAAPAGGVTAVLQPVVTGGVLSLVIIDPGHGYTSAPTITVSGGAPGTGASFTPILSRGVTSVSMGPINVGSGYGANVQIAVTFSAPVGVSPANGGITATGYALTNALGNVIQVVVTNTGAGYNSETATVTIAAPMSGVTAIGTCVMGVGPAITLAANGAGAGVTNPAVLGSATVTVHSVPNDWSGLVQGSIYEGQYGEQYTITVTTGGTTNALLRVRSASGGFSADGVVPTNEGYTYRISDPSLGGLILELVPPSAGAPLVVGQVFQFVVIGKYLPLQLSNPGQVAAINVLAAGSGYGDNTTTGNYAPVLTISAPPAGGVQATAECWLATDVQSITVSAGGTGYTYVPTVVISAPVQPGGTQATATAVLTGTSVTSVVMVSHGSGYSQNAAPTATITGGGGTGATLLVITNISGVIAGTLITNPGSGYVNPPEITLTNVGAGTGAILTTTVSTAATSQDLTILPGETFTGEVNDTYQITVLKGDNLGATQNSFTGALIQVNDTAGVDAPVQLTVAQGVAYPLGSSGLQFMFPSGLVTPSGLSGGTTATATATESGGAVTGFTVTSGGTGYVVPPVVTISGVSGTGAIGTAVIENGVVVDILVSSAGSGYGSNPTVTIAAPVTYQGGLRTGDVYYINCKAAAPTGPASIIVLSGQATDITGWTNNDLTLNLFNIDARVIYSGVINPQRDQAPLLAWTAGTTAQGGITVANNLDLQVSTRTAGNQWVPVQNSAYARLFASWRGLIPSQTTDVITSYPDTTAAIAKYGADDIDNPMCYGLCIAIKAAQGNPVYGMSVPTNDVAGYTSVLKQAANYQNLVYEAPMTSDPAITALFPPHVDAASLANVELWRRAYITTVNPGPYAYLTEDSNGNPLLGTVTTNGTGNVRVLCEAANFLTNNVLPGDLYQTQYGQDEWGNVTYQQYVIESVLEQDELLLASGPALPISSPIQFQIWKANTGTNQATYVGDVSNSIQDRRISNIWCDSPTINPNGAIVPLPVYYIAAEIAGLRSASLPQQGLSRTALQYSATGCPTMFRNYTASDLNIAAANGTWIVTQDYAGGPVYIRHQLTTNSDNGILYYEDSVGVNLDDIAYQVKAIIAPYPGRRNVNSETLEEIETKLRGLFSGMLQDPVINVNNIGPQLLAFADLLVTNNANFLDEVDVQVTLTIPVPLNKLIVTLYGTATQQTTTVTIQATQTTA